jgi:hypothetical protein
VPTSRTGVVYVALLLLSGVAIAFYVAGRPGLESPVLPPYAWPLAVSLVLDVAVMQLARQGRATPLTMGERIVGVFGAGLVVTAAMAWRGPG